MSKKQGTSPFRAVISDYAQQARRDWKYAVPAILLPSLGQIFSVYVPPLIVAAMIKRFAGHESTLSPETAMPYLLAFGGVWLFGQAIWRVAMYFVFNAELSGIKALDARAFRELTSQDPAFFHDNFAGSLTKKLLGYSRRYENVFDTFTFNISANILPLVFACAILASYSPLLAIALIAMLVMTFLVMLPFIRRRMQLVAEREEAANHMAGHVADVIGNIDTVKAFAHQKSEVAHHDRLMRTFLKKTHRTWSYQNTHVEMITSPFFVITNLVGLYLATTLGGTGLEISTLFIIFNYYANATGIVWDFTRVYRGLESALSEAAEFKKLLQDTPKITSPAGVPPIKVRSGTITFDTVTFSYEETMDDHTKHLFSNLSLQLTGGKKYALVGRSGGGKSTITKLLLRFMDITSGAVLIDGQDIRQVDIDSLRHSIAYVPQEPVMFHRSLLENIRYGRPDATDEEVMRAARLAHAHQFITKLPSGYDTLVGERGIKLSGGQRQRVAIARAILKDAPIIILDEATSALDSESEQHIQAALASLLEGRTAVVIAHRLSTIQKMDHIIVLEDGDVAEAGTHAQLLSRGGIYAQLWSHQSGGFIEE